MKNAIKYYYDLNVDSIVQNNNDYFLIINNNKYSFVETNVNDIMFCYNLSNAIKDASKIILNKNNTPSVNYNGKNYVLMQVLCPNRLITLSDIINFSDIYLYNNIIDINWDVLWENKVDNIEYQISQIEKKYPVLKSSFNYYCGLSETAILFFKGLTNKKTLQYIQNNRIKYNSKMEDLYNPLSYMFDSKVRNLCDYLKSEFFYGNKDIYDETDQILNTLSNDEKYYFFARMLYPTYYYDAYDNIVINNSNENTLKKIIEKVDKYEQYIKKIYLKLKSEYNINIIEWIIKI